MPSQTKRESRKPASVMSYSGALKILHVIPSMSLRTGGPPVSVTNLSRGLQLLGHMSVVYSTSAATPASSNNFRSQIAGDDLPVGASEIDLYLFSLRSPHRFIYAPSLGQELRNNAEQFDLIHVHSLYLYPQLAAWRAATKANVPYVVSPRGALDPYLLKRGRLQKWVLNTLWQKRMLDNAAAIHYTSEEEKRLAEVINIKAQAFVLPNIVDLAPYGSLPSGADFREQLRLRSDVPLILNHGRLSHKKGLDILIRAMASVVQVLPSAHLALVGADDENITPTLQRLALDLGIEKSISFVNPLKGKDLLSALAAAKIWVLPSHGENFGMAVVEAMAAGVPVVCSPHVNIANEAVAAEALRVSPNSPEILANTILTILKDPETAKALGRAGRDFSSRYDLASSATLYGDFYTQVICEFQRTFDGPRRGR